MENYVKRCVALPGETVSIVDGQLHIDGVPVDNPEGLQEGVPRPLRKPGGGPNGLP